MRVQEKTPSAVEADSDVTLTEKRGEARVDSRLIAESLGNRHKNVIELVGRYKSDFAQFGKVAFKTEPLPSGQRERLVLLNEDQAYLLLTYSRNTGKYSPGKAGGFRL